MTIFDQVAKDLFEAITNGKPQIDTYETRIPYDQIRSTQIARQEICIHKNSDDGIRGHRSDAMP
jgi:hypothetical protein